MLYLLLNVLVFFETFHMKEYGKKIICGRLKTQKIEIIFFCEAPSQLKSLNFTRTRFIEKGRKEK